jgi:hypothetical protein
VHHGLRTPDELLLGERLRGLGMKAATNKAAKTQRYYPRVQSKLVTFQDSKWFGCGIDGPPLDFDEDAVVNDFAQ